MSDGEAETWLRSSDARFYGYDNSTLEFVKASRFAVNEAARRRKWLVYGLAGLAILSATLTVTLGIKYLVARQGREAAFKDQAADALYALPAHPDRSVASAKAALASLGEAPTDQHWEQLLPTLHSVVPLLENLRAHRDIPGIQSATFSADSRYIVVATGQGKAYVWAWQSKDDPQILDEGQGQLNSAAFSSDAESKYVVTSSDDGNARVWDWRKKTVLGRMSHGAPVKNAKFVPGTNDEFIATLADDGIARIWDWKQEGKRAVWEWKGEEKSPELVPVDTLQVIAVGTEGRIAMGGQEGWLTICQWLSDQRTCEVKVHFKLHDEALRSIEFSEDGRFVATAGKDRKAFVVDSSSGDRVPLKVPNDVPDVNTGVIFSAKFSQGDPHLVVTASYGGDLTGGICTRWNERESTWRKAGHANQEVQARADRKGCETTNLALLVLKHHTHKRYSDNPPKPGCRCKKPVSVFSAKRYNRLHNVYALISIGTSSFERLSK